MVFTMQSRILLVAFVICASLTHCFALAKYTTNNDGNTPCGDGWYYSLELDQCYYVSSNYTTFKNADTFCQDIGGRLVSIYSDLEYYTISAYIEQQGFVEPYWIGLKEISYSPYFRWLDNTNANYTHWINGTAPSHNDSTACFAWSKTLANNGWLQVYCQNPLPYICKKHATSNTVIKINGTTGTLSSPNYPAPYYANSFTSYYITVPDSYAIDLSFDFIGIDSGSYIYVYDNLTLIDTTTSRTRPHSVESISNQLYVEFDTSKKGNEKYIGWKASFKTFVPITMEGSFNSPNYPNNYTTLQNITKYVHVPDGFGILFNILDFSSETGYDNLTITTDTGTLTKLIGHYNAFPFTIRTNASAATLLWFSDGWVTDRGFNLTYVADPNYT